MTEGGTREREYVFGYGSLSTVGDDPIVCELRGFRRTWNVAMENSRTIPGYKYYVDPMTGTRPDRFVVFLNIVPDRSARVNGVMVKVTRDLLERLDARERNYERVDISAQVTPGVDGRVWAYAGSDAAVRRFQLGVGARRAVISRDYHDGVLESFGSFGPGARQRFIELTDPVPCPIVDLRRVDLGDDPGSREVRRQARS